MDCLYVDRSVYVQLLQKCGAAGVLPGARQVHAWIVENDSSLHQGLYIGNHLLGVYCKCGSPDDAHWIFDRMPEKDVISWNTMILTCSQGGHTDRAFQLFKEMDKHCVEPTKVTFLNVLKACSNLAEGERVYASIKDTGLESDLIVGNALVSMFGKCGSLDMAVKTFLMMSQRDTITWTTMIATYIYYGHAVQALEIFKRMTFEGAHPTIMTYATVLNACTNPKTLMEGESIHIYLVKVGLELFEILGRALLSMYGKCGMVDDARWVFDSANKHDVITWNSMISTYNGQGCSEKALDLYTQMNEYCVKPNSVTFVSILDACTNLIACAEGMLVHYDVLDKGIKSSAVWNALLNLYGACGSTSDAIGIFERMQERDVVSWSSLIQVFMQSNQTDRGFQSFERMQIAGVQPNRVTLLNMVKACIDQCKMSDGRLMHTLIVDMQLELDLVICNGLITMYGNHGSPMDAHHVFTSLSTCDAVSWTAVIAAHAQNGCKKEALRFFLQMLGAGVPSTDITYISILEALTSFTSMEDGQMVHYLSVESGSSVTVGNAFINFYAKCGKLNEASYLFRSMPCTDIVSWSSLITAYANQGQGEKAFNLLLELKEAGLKPDDIMFVSLLSSCSHAGLVAEGFDFFHLMVSVCEILPSEEHSRCMVDLLSRIGWLDEVESLIKTLPYAPTFGAWMTLLGACRVHNNPEKGRHIAEHVLELNSRNSAGYVILSNIYVAAGMKVEADKLWKTFKETDVNEGFDEGLFGDWYKDL
ncbi:hypothetical protein L7F22_068731 [Adiantum nelumboides]|nr:hypothetical protein [Adiantum nelumboides]